MYTKEFFVQSKKIGDTMSRIDSYSASEQCLKLTVTHC